QPLVSVKKYFLLCLPGMILLVTGCPYNEYVVELTPRGDVMERKLAFEDGKPTNGTPNFISFPSNELATIARVYPRDGVKHKGNADFAIGKFAEVMPADIGGAGYYTNLKTSFGTTALYMERFRGNDDLAATMEKRFRAADQLTDLIIGWTRSELGRE